MQFAYQFPERSERLVLVSAGGVGREVNPVLRLVSLPGRRPDAVAAAAARHAAGQVGARRPADALLDTDLGQDAADMLTPGRRAARRDLAQRLHPHAARGRRLARPGRDHARPLLPDRGHADLLLWGDRDSVVPVRHALVAHEAMPGSRLEIFEGAGHFPLHSDPARVRRPRRGVHHRYGSRRLEPRALARRCLCEGRPATRATRTTPAIDRGHATCGK